MPRPWAAGARVRVVGRLSGQLTNNVMHFATNTVINDPVALNQLLQQLAQAVHDCIRDAMLPFATNDWKFESVEATGIYPTLTDPVSVTNAANAVANGNPQGVGFASALISIRTGTGGKSGRGRIFAPPGGENVATAGTWDPAFLALVAQFCACMAGKFIGAGHTTPWFIGVLSRKVLRGGPMLFDDAFREAISLEPESVIAQMGTRKLGRGA